MNHFRALKGSKYNLFLLISYQKRLTYFYQFPFKTIQFIYRYLQEFAVLICALFWWTKRSYGLSNTTTLTVSYSEIKKHVWGRGEGIELQKACIKNVMGLTAILCHVILWRNFCFSFKIPLNARSYTNTAVVFPHTIQLNTFRHSTRAGLKPVFLPVEHQSCNTYFGIQL